ncbi:MAG: hypothetical protein IKW59_04635 [Clostridia bacterium]|nr:hypothetical protein [Clostridia bacterium]
MAKKMAFSSILMALAIVCLFGASIVPTARISMLALTSVFGAITVAEYGPKYGLIHYLGVSILSLLLIPKKLLVIIYIVFLGYYPIVKMFIERLDRRAAEWLIKIIVFNLFLVIGYIVFKALFLPSMESAVVMLVLKYLPWVILASEAVFVIYDYVLSYIITYYYKILQIKINGGK